MSAKVWKGSAGKQIRSGVVQAVRQYAATKGKGNGHKSDIHPTWKQKPVIHSTPLPPGARVHYACIPPIYGTVLYVEGECHWVDFGEEGKLRCATRDLSVCAKGM